MFFFCSIYLAPAPSAASAAAVADDDDDDVMFTREDDLSISHIT